MHTSMRPRERLNIRLKRLEISRVVPDGLGEPRGREGGVSVDGRVREE